MFNKEQLEALISTVKENISLAESLLETKKYEDVEAVKSMIASQQKTLEDYTKRLENIKVGRPSIGATRKVSITLPERIWDWFDEKADGNRSGYLREIILKSLGNESEWSNNAAYGYTILAAEALKMDEEEISELRKAMYYQMDLKTVDEAKEVYNNSIY